MGKQKKESGAMNFDAIKETGEDENKVTQVRRPIGVVTGCSSLNVRSEAAVDSEIVSALRVGAEVTIDEDDSTEDFFKVCTSAGVEGYCVKQYISIL